MHSQENILKEINGLMRKPQRISHLLSPKEESRLLQALPITSLEDLSRIFSRDPEIAREIEDWAREEVTAKTLAHVELWAQRTANRALYVPTPVLTAYQFTAERVRVSYKYETRCAGLLEQMVQYLHGPQNTPVGVYLQDQTENGAWSTSFQEAMRTAGIRSSKGKLLWNMKNVAWQYLLRAFPADIDCQAYGHSLMTPLVPHGFIPRCPVTFARMKDHLGNTVRTDGSGIYHPEAPQMAALVAQYGPVAFQFRYLHTSGLFAKGMLFPSELAISTEGKPTVVMDWLQVKGQFKARAKELYGQDQKKDAKNPENGFLGVLRVRSRATSMSSSFEILENIQMNEQTKQIVAKKVQEALEKVIRRGPLGLLRRIQAKDQNVKHMVQMIHVLAEAGEDVSPMQVERIRSAVKDALKSELYRIAQGGGLQFRAYDARMDSTVPPGQCVVSGLPPGLRIASMRLPIVLAQSLLVLKTTNPRPHHLYRGKMPPGIIIMNPQDLVVRMQGDDDGDTIGVSTDPEVVELFRNRIDNNIYRIEPEGTRIEHPTPSLEGENTMLKDQRGEVGRLCLLHSKLLAVGDVAGANGMALSIQEAVDRAKKIIQYSDFRRASSMASWTKLEDGTYKFEHRLPESITPMGVYPMELAENWVGNRLVRAGCYQEQEDGSIVPLDPLTWRPRDKKIAPENWKPTKHVNGFKGGNLVHYAHDAAWNFWHKNSQEFHMEADKAVDIEPLLYRALKARGHEPEIYRLREEGYADLYAKSGLRTFAEEMAALRKQKMDADSRNAKINSLQQRLERRLQKLEMAELLTIWHYECQEGNITNALRAICWDQSPVLVALDLQEPTKCPFLTPDRITKVVGLAVQDQQPHKKLQEMVLNANKHQKEILDENGQGIPIFKCPECMDKLQDALVHHVRYKKNHYGDAFMARLTSTVNGLLKCAAEEPTTHSSHHDEIKL